MFYFHCYLKIESRVVLDVITVYWQQLSIKPQVINIHSITTAVNIIKLNLWCVFYTHNCCSDRPETQDHTTRLTQKKIFRFDYQQLKTSTSLQVQHDCFWKPLYVNLPRLRYERRAHCRLCELEDNSTKFRAGINKSKSNATSPQSGPVEMQLVPFFSSRKTNKDT